MATNQNSPSQDSRRLTDDEICALVEMLSNKERCPRLVKIREAIQYEMDSNEKLLAELEARRDDLDNEIATMTTVQAELEDAHRCIEGLIPDNHDPEHADYGKPDTDDVQ